MNNKIIGVIALLLMVFAMILYVVSDDEAIPPVADGPAVENPAGQSVPMPAAE